MCVSAKKRAATLDFSTEDAMANFLDRDRFGMYKSGSDDGPGPALMGADTLLGNDVVNAQEDDLGDIKEIMLDMRSGRIAYAVLSFGGLFGMGDKLFAIPWQALRLDTENHRFVLDVPKERLESAPGFDKDRWPDMADTRWQDEIHSFYGTEPYDDDSTRMTGSMRGVHGNSLGTGVGAGGGSMGAGHAGSSSSSGLMGAAGGMATGIGASRDILRTDTDPDLSNPGTGQTTGSTYKERDDTP
jgi:sporulation protein YlmC with PRC-barrel domain